MFLDANKRDSLVAHGEKTVDTCNSSIRRTEKEFATDRRGEISLFAAF